MANQSRSPSVRLKNSAAQVVARSKCLGCLPEGYNKCSILFRFLIFASILAYCAIFPALYYVGPQMDWFEKGTISYAAIMYYLVFNTLMLIGLGYCIVGYVTYPYSNSYFNKNHKRQTNQRFGSEFIKCTERICRVVQDMSEQQSSQNTSAILLSPMEDT
jgi:hypothetical protein